MIRKNYFKPICFLFFLLCGATLLSSCSKDNDNMPPQTSLEVAKMDFSKALEEWNQPENFVLQERQTSNNLLQNRLENIQKEAELLLLSSGKTQEEINSMNLEQKFLIALEIYTKNTNKSKN